jgi:hypothetical protein
VLPVCANIKIATTFNKRFKIQSKYIILFGLTHVVHII